MSLCVPPRPPCCHCHLLGAREGPPAWTTPQAPWPWLLSLQPAGGTYRDQRVWESEVGCLLPPAPALGAASAQNPAPGRRSLQLQLSVPRALPSLLPPLHLQAWRWPRLPVGGRARCLPLLLSRLPLTTPLLTSLTLQLERAICPLPWP